MYNSNDPPFSTICLDVLYDSFTILKNESVLIGITEANANLNNVGKKVKFDPNIELNSLIRKDIELFDYDVHMLKSLSVTS